MGGDDGTVYQQYLRACRILGVREQDSMAQVKAAHRRLALRYHPDRQPGNDSEAFRRVQEAYEVVSQWLEFAPERLDPPVEVIWPAPAGRPESTRDRRANVAGPLAFSPYDELMKVLNALSLSALFLWLASVFFLP